MPHFTLPIGAEGPMVIAYVGVSEGRRKALTDAALNVPAPIQVRALVDTGASCTCVDPQVLTDLGLSPTGKTSVVTAGGVPEERDQYDALLAVPGSGPEQAPLIVPTIAVVATPLFAAQQFHVLLGRDILERCILHYNGAVQTFSVAY